MNERPEDPTRVIRWGILAPGKIAHAFASALRVTAGAELVAVGSRDRGRAEAFAAMYGIPRPHGSYADLAADPGVDAVYVASPHSEHEAHAVLCLEAGKHVLCEKALAVNAAQAERMFACARERDLVLMEAMWTRFLPVMVRVRELLAAGEIGDVRMVLADFGFRAPFDPASRLFAPGLAGGALLDGGVYPLNLAFMVCGPPEEIHTAADLGSTGVDEQAGILLRHAGGRISVLSCANRVDTPREAAILGTAGRITIPRPWWAGSRLVLQREQRPDEIFDLPGRGGGYAHEAEAFMDLVRTGRRESPVMPPAESLAVLRAMDEIRARWGLRYPGE